MGSGDRFIQSVRKYKKILIVIKGSPDPDAIASSHAMALILENQGITPSIISNGIVSLAQNSAFIKALKIPVNFIKDIPDNDRYDAYMVLDHQSAYIKGLTGKIPCAAHIDHHQIIREEIEPDFTLIDEEAGSTSTLIALLLKDLSLSLDGRIMTNICTALLYGIQTDTDKYEHASRLDFEALNYISSYSDARLIQDVLNQPLSEETILMIGKAIRDAIIYKDWLIAGVGYIDESIRDSIALAADFLLKRQKVNTVIVFAAVHRQDRLRLDVSLRTDRELVDLNAIIKRITPTGGARKFKGAYQINLDYFSQAPDRELLWDVIRSTTVEILKEQRDTIYLTEIKGIYRRFKNRLDSMIKR